MTIAICGLKFFFEHTLHKEWTTFNIVRPAPEKKLPVILSVAEVRQILSRINWPRYKVCLTTIYSCGLRLQEGTHLLSPIFRAKFREQLGQSDLFTQVKPPVWQQDWVVHSQPIGTGQAAFKYLAPYIFRVAISNHRIIKLENGAVTFKYKESATRQVRCATVSAQEFMRRFLQHVLPDRFVKVRYYGLLSPANRPLLQQARQLLSASTAKLKPDEFIPTSPRTQLSCPHCGGPLTLLAPLAPRGHSS